jgi:hypothetical protein
VCKATLLPLAAVGILGVSVFGQGHSSQVPKASRINPQWLSQGAKMWWFGPQPSGSVAKMSAAATGANVDAASPAEDVAGGQSEVAIAAAGQRVMVAWNDATGFFVLPTTDPRASGTGAGFSRDGGAHFTDLGGLPNNDPNQQWSGDPGVVAVDNGAFFIVSSIYAPALSVDCSQGPARYAIAVSVGTVTSTGVTFSHPVIASTGGDLCSVEGPTAFLDKDFMRYDPATRTLALSYSRFGFFTSGLGQIEVVTAKVPASPPLLSSANFSSPTVVWPEEQFVENEGSYLTLAKNPNNTNSIYVTWERNWGTNQGNGDPYVYILAAEVQGGKVTVGGPSNPVIVTLGQANSNAFGGVKSLDMEQITGYSRFFGNDFPRIAYDSTRNRVAIVWNDASHHPLGDIFMRTYGKGLTDAGTILRLNSDTSGALKFMPAVCFLSDGSMVTSWYDRRGHGASSTLTDYWGDIRPAPYAAANNFKITTVATDWNGTGSIINPNFGDYTDNTCDGMQPYFTWSDGRIGVPQPFVAK